MPTPHSHRPRESKPSSDRLAALIEKAGIRLGAGQLEQLWLYHNLLRTRNEDRDLTRIINLEQMVLKHYVDCMSVGNLTRIPSPLVDIGSGAGFPGIPLKIRYPSLEIILAEPRPNRVAFLRESIAALGLKKATVFDHKLVSQSFQAPMKGAITRALETMDKTLLRTSACLGVGGQIIFLKGPGVDPEFAEIERRFPGKFQLLLNQAYKLPILGHERRLIVLEKRVAEEIPAKVSKDSGG